MSNVGSDRFVSSWFKFVKSNCKACVLNFNADCILFWSIVNNELKSNCEFFSSKAFPVKIFTFLFFIWSWTIWVVDDFSIICCTSDDG